MKKPLFFSMTILTLIGSFSLIYAFVSIYFNPEGFYYFGFSFLIMIFVSIGLLLVYSKYNMSSKMLKSLIFVMIFINLCFFAIYFFYFIKYVFWDVGSSGE